MKHHENMKKYFKLNKLHKFCTRQQSFWNFQNDEGKCEFYDG